MKIIFLDIDGPMLPLRSYILAENHRQKVSRFDPVAAAMVRHLAEKAPAQIVVSSAWRIMGQEFLSTLLHLNGIPHSLVHEDWQTPTLRARCPERADEVLAWLKRHPEVTAWVAFDDEPGPAPNWVQCSFEDGLQHEHFTKAATILGVEALGVRIIKPSAAQ